MRLYRLISRTGRKKKRLTPWFKPPAAGAPVRYFGWYWDPELKEWLPLDITKLMVTVPVQDVQMPTTMPSRTQPARVPGWEYNFQYNEWMHVVQAEPVMEFTPPRPLKPDMNMDDVQKAAVYDVDVRAVIETIRLDWVPASGFTRTHIDNLIRMLEKSGYSRAAADDIMRQYVKLTAGMDAAGKAEVWKKATDAIFRCWQRTHLVGTSTAQKYWAENVRNQMRDTSQLVGPVAAVAILSLIAAVTGFLLGRMLDLILTPAEDAVTLVEKARTYLMGPDYWYYSRMISRTRKGVPFYSQCEEIGTTYVRLKRGTGAGEIDIIDFPGGFLEEGYVFPYFVKYNWTYWTLSYVGMLSHQGVNWYSLRKGNYDSGGLRPGSMIPDEEWCAGFHWYL